MLNFQEGYSTNQGASKDDWSFEVKEQMNSEEEEVEGSVFCQIVDYWFEEIFLPVTLIQCQ